MEEGKKKEGFFMLLGKNVKLQIAFFVVSMGMLFLIYFPMFLWMKDKAFVNGVLSGTNNFDIQCLYNVRSLVKEDIELHGWINRNNSNITDIRIALKDVDDAKVHILETKEVEKLSAEGEEIFEERARFKASISNSKIGQGSCFEIYIKLNYYENKDKKQILKEEMIKTDLYLLNGVIYEYNPRDFFRPQFESLLMKDVVSQGMLCACDMNNGAWIYSYKNNLYWIVNPNMKNNQNKDLYMTYYIYMAAERETSETEIKYCDFIFDKYEMKFDTPELYRVAVMQFDNYDNATYISTGHYDLEKGTQWNLKFPVYRMFQ